jgi:hypothetical protein
MLKYNHLGIPTNTRQSGERYLADFKMYISGYESSQYKIEWMRFEPGCPLPELVQTVPHVAFVVENLAAEIKGKHVIIQPNSPSAGVQVAFIEENGAPIELMQFEPGTII